MELAYKAGLRLNEAIHVTWDDLDFEQASVTVRAKPDNGRTIGWQPKGKKSRTIPVPQSMIESLARAKLRSGGDSPYPLISAERLKAIRQAKDEGIWGEGQKTLSGLHREWGNLINTAGLVDDSGKGNATIHDLRRSAITN